MNHPDNQFNHTDKFGVHIEGHVKITSYESRDQLLAGQQGEVVLDKRNAIHKENASILIARGIGARPGGSVYTMHFGRGGATVDELDIIVYATPNTTGAADLNTPVYFEVVDEEEGAPTGNFMAVRHINGTLFSDIEIRCILDKNEPFGQPATDNIPGININTNQFIFNEIGLKTEDGLLITHVVFAPVLKSANRIFQVVYTLRVRIV